ncbi:MAG TPA: hypothetical protein VF395_21405 [Polyangiaceae bacterium]
MSLRAAVPRAATIGVALLLVFVLCVVFSASRRWHALPPVVHPGDTLYELTPSLLTGVDYDTRGRHLHASRTGTESPFDIVITDPGGSVIEKCRGGAVFEEAVQKLVPMRAKRSLSPEEVSAARALPLATNGKLRVQDTTNAEPLDWEMIVEPGVGQVLALRGDTGFELLVPFGVFERLAAGCVALGLPAKR